MRFDTAHNTLSPCFCKVLIGIFFLLAGLAVHIPGHAQASPPAAGNETPYAVLADLLENPQTRDQLIQELRTMAPQGDSKAQPQTGAHPPRADNASTQAGSQVEISGDAGKHISPTQRLALTLRHTTNDLSSAAAAVKSLAQGKLPFTATAPSHGDALRLLAATVLATLAAYLVFRLAAGAAFTRLNRWIQTEQPREGGRRKPGLALSRKLIGVAAALAVDLAATLLAALAGYAAALFLAEQENGTTGLAFQFLSAFAMIEAVKALSRGVFATRYEHLRLLPLQPATARYWNRWLTLLIGLTGYCLLAVVPITQAIMLPSLGRLLGLLIMLGVYVYGVRVVWSHRKSVKAGLTAWAEKSSTAVFGTLIRVLARLWHVIAIAYLTVLLVASQAEQQLALAFMMRATAQSVVAIIAGALLAAALSSLLARRIVVPDAWNKALPLLETRINSYVPAALKGLRLLILILVALVVLDAWHAFDLGAWLDSDSGRAVIAVILKVGVILAIAALSWTIIASLIEHRLGAGGLHRRPSEREKTLLMLFRNAAAVVIATMTVLVVLSQIGIDIGPLIAGAGVAGLAIGFGAQKLVQDVITGVFIQLENGMNQNDIVEVCGLFGTVEKITIRSVVIRTLDGGYHLIPFSSIDKVSNHTRDYGYHYGEYNVAHRENVDQAIAQMEMAFKDLMQDPELAPEVLEDISIPGVTALNEQGFRIRVLIKTTPGNQWAVQRGYNKLLKQRFDAAGIEVPYPHTVLHFGRDKDGYAPPVDVRAVDSLQEITRPAAG